MRGQALYFSPRLLERLRVLDSKGIAYVEAPAGYGKTTAVRHYLRVNRFPVLWVSALDSGPGNKDLFWRDLCRTLKAKLPISHDLAKALLQLGYPHGPPQAEAAVELLEQLPVTQPTVLAIDDLHLLHPEEKSDAGIFRVCELLVSRGRLDLRLVLLSRHIYGGRSAALQFKGLLDCITVDVFALNAEEIAGYCAMRGVPVSRERAEMLHEATGGWINALYLTLLHFQAHGDFSCPSIVTALLRQEVYVPLSVWERHFLIGLSVLESFTLGQAEGVAVFLGSATRKDWYLPESGEEEEFGEAGGTGGSAAGQDMPGAALTLRKLVARNAFICYDETSRTYTLHALFRNFIQSRFLRLPEKLQQRIHRCHAAWFIRQRDYENALVSLFASGDRRRALEILEFEPRLRLMDRANFYERFFRGCPDELLLRYPAAAFKYAFFAFSNKDFATFHRLLAALENVCVSLSPDDQYARNLRGEMEILRSFAAFNDIAAMSEHHRRASSLLQGQSRYFGVEPWTLGSPSVMFAHHSRVGKLNESVTQMLRCLPVYSRLTSMHGAGAEYQMQAEALFFAGEFDKAEIVCRHALFMAREHKQLSIELCALLFGALMRLIRGEALNVEALLRNMRTQVTERREFSLLRTIDLCRGILYLFQGQTDEIPDWLRQSEGYENSAYALTEGVNYIIYGRFLLAEKKFSQLLGFFSWILSCGKFDTKILLILNAHLFMAAAHNARGNMDFAADSLQAALALALPDKLYTPFAALWEFLLPVFRHMEHAGAPFSLPCESAYTTIQNLGALWYSRKQALSGRSGVVSGQPPQLTRRELQLVRLAATGKTYPEIAKVLGLAPNTVKKVFSSIFRKNGLQSRHQLVELLDRLPAQE